MRPVPKEEGAGAGAAHEAGGVVEEHTDGDVLIPGVGHGELRQVGGDGLVQVHLSLLHQGHHQHGGVGLADGAHAVEDVVGEGPVLSAGVGAGGAGQNDLAVLPQGVGHAVRAAVLKGGFRRRLGGLGQGGGLSGRSCFRRSGLRRQGGAPEGKEQRQGQGKGPPPQGCQLHVSCSPFILKNQKNRPARRPGGGRDRTHYTDLKREVKSPNTWILCEQSLIFVP